jgi:hypothetical protein
MSDERRRRSGGPWRSPLRRVSVCLQEGGSAARTGTGRRSRRTRRPAPGSCGTAPTAGPRHGRSCRAPVCQSRLRSLSLGLAGLSRPARSGLYRFEFAVRGGAAFMGPSSMCFSCGRKGRGRGRGAARTTNKGTVRCEGSGRASGIMLPFAVISPWLEEPGRKHVTRDGSGHHAGHVKGNDAVGSRALGACGQADLWRRRAPPHDASLRAASTPRALLRRRHRYSPTCTTALETQTGTATEGVCMPKTTRYVCPPSTPSPIWSMLQLHHQPSIYTPPARRSRCENKKKPHPPSYTYPTPSQKHQT